MSTKIIWDHNIGPAIVDLIDEAKEVVVLVSPYLDLWKRIEDAIERAVKRNVDVTVFFRSDSKKKYEAIIKQLVEVGVGVGDIENLHVKLYYNEQCAIVTSMNLYDYSDRNNFELGVIIDDRESLEEIDHYIDRLGENAKKSIKNPLTSIVSGLGKGLKKAAEKLNNKGYCIRCGERIKLDGNRPLCDKHYKSWARYKDEDYEEKYCLYCGKKHKTSYSRPLCKTCWKKQVAIY